MLRTALLAFAVPVLLGSRAGVALVHSPAEGAERTLTVLLEGSLTGGELEVIMDGNPVPASFLPELDLEVHDERRYDLSERAQEDGWVRSYDRLSWTNHGSMGVSEEDGSGTYPWTAEGRSALTGRKLRFEPSGEGFDCAFADDEGGDAALLEGVGAVLDGRELLPRQAVDVGESWTVDGAELGFLFEPAGELAWEFPPEAAMHLLPEIRSRSVAGELALELTKLERDVAHCTIAGRLVRTTTQKGDLSQVQVVDGTATDTVSETWDVEGELLWSAKRSELVSLKLAGELASATRTERDPGQAGSTYVSLFHARGSQSLSILSSSHAAESDG